MHLAETLKQSLKLMVRCACCSAVDGLMQITQPTNCRMVRAKHPRNHAVLPHICVNLNNLGSVIREPPKIPPETMSGYKILHIRQPSHPPSSLTA
jgi:hypothetical protein